MQKETVVVAMSGGVDSSASAYLLKEQGYNVIGAIMILTDSPKTSDSIKDAEEVCKTLDIKLHIFDLRKEFKDIVINNFITSYQNGTTPNPCIVCNKHFKFGLFYEKAKELGADYIATGHYTKIENGLLKRANNKAKDQSYFLYGIKKDLLKHIIFPLSDYDSKEEVREIAKRAGLSVNNKKDSQEVCFVPNDDYKTFLYANSSIKDTVGDICLEDGTILGKHTGITNYTIGQRKGLNISYKEPLYVIDIDHIKNKVIVGPNTKLFHNKLIATDVNFLTDDIEKEIYAKIRSRGNLEEAIIEVLANNQAQVTFKNPQRAITKGQSVVFYNKSDICLGGGIISEII